MKTSRCPRLKKWIKRLAFALVALVTLTALVLAIEGYRATPMLLGSLHKSLDKAVASQTTVTLARVACALERHRIAHAQYPETLDELAPRFLSRIPPDPVNGGPLHYRCDDPDRFTLYSVGLNEKDDGGVAPVPTHGSFGPRAPSGDWVWRSHPVGTHSSSR